ncbi:hypothetical protein [Anditalea andensis]|uniref:Uncharacterized protein n=1 Tax=Anditalea andensis TaxID=1048983 RepID=A0A074KZL0_9BACT|nr:hypothetical protein [Anditalea andensis]KEO73053.1 hypothetical protein EL17_15695 [Anditalea andensis]
MRTSNFSEHESDAVEQVIKERPPFLVMNGSFFVVLIIAVSMALLSLYRVDGITVHQGIIYRNPSTGATELKLNILEDQIAPIKAASKITVRCFSDNREIATLDSISVDYAEGNGSLALILSEDGHNYINRFIWEDETVAVKISFKTPEQAIYKQLKR